MFLVLAVGIITVNAVTPGVSHPADEITSGTIAGTLTIKDGKVGIGTTEPQSELDVAGNVNANNIVLKNLPDTAPSTNLADIICDIDPRYCVQLYNNNHAQRECTEAGGTVVTVETSVNICQFSARSCPSGWTWYKNWCTTSRDCCSGDNLCSSDDCCTGSHSWANKDAEKCSYRDDFPYCSWSSCRADITKIGCY